jgi:hypothetical protein
MGIKHKFVSGKSDEADASLVRPSNWNADHDLTIDGFEEKTAEIVSGDKIFIADGADANKVKVVDADKVAPVVYPETSWAWEIPINQVLQDYEF